MTKRKQQDSFEFPAVYVEYLFEEVTAIKKAVFTCEPDRVTVQIGIFRDPVMGVTVGAYLERDEAGEIIKSTLVRTEEPDGLAWYQSMQQSFLWQSLN